MRLLKLLVSVSLLLGPTLASFNAWSEQTPLPAVGYAFSSTILPFHARIKRVRDLIQSKAWH